ncbi:MAG: NADH-quinone oxidoreductase subunit J [Clostridium sp.]|nr:NADH-quinone oxidoreductase subunit J [Clostridium sp.]
MDSEVSIFWYWIIALSIVVFSVLTVTTRRLLRSATYLLFALFATAALYFQLNYEFLGGVEIAVYAGGIVVLFVFAILLTTHPGERSAILESRRRVMGGIGAAAMFLVAGYALWSRVASACVSLPAMDNPTMHRIGTLMMGSGHGQYLLPFEAISVLLLACIIGGVVVARKR